MSFLAGDREFYVILVNSLRSFLNQHYHMNYINNPSIEIVFTNPISIHIYNSSTRKTLILN